MLRHAAVVGLMFVSASPALGDVNPADLQSALSLQRAMQQTIRDVEPAIACILVSRSDYGRGTARENGSGKLGGFDPFSFTGTLEQRKRLDLASPQMAPEGYGSGIVVDPRGLVLTNYHVVRGATKIFVRLPGGKGSYADIHAADWRCDLAMLRLLEPPANLNAVRFGNGARAERGEFILSIANPFAVGFRDGQPSASWGIISNIRRWAPSSSRELERVKSLQHYGTLLQVDARLNLGCSGGALVTLRGEVIGITSALAGIHGGETPGGFAVPVDEGLLRIIEVLKRGEEVEYGFLGVAFREQTQRADGVQLHEVIPGSPAQLDANLNPGDVILAVNGTPVHENDDLFLELGKQLAGTKVKLRVVRRSSVPPRTEDAQVTLAKFHVPGDRIVSSTANRPYIRGLRVDYSSLVVQQVPRFEERIPEGVLVSDIKANTPAAATQLKPGDIITHVNNQAIHTPAGFYQAVGAQAGAIELLVANQKDVVILR